MLRINSYTTVKFIILAAVLNIASYYTISKYFFAFKVLLGVFMNIAGILMIIFYFYLKKFINPYISLYYKFMFFLTIFWGLVVFGRSFSTNVHDMITLFTHYLMGWVWLIPLVYVFGYRKEVWLNLFTFLTKLMLIGIFLSLLVIFIFNDLNNLFAVMKFLMFWPIILLTFFYQNKINKIIAIITFIFFVIISYLVSQRANIIFIFIYLFFFFIEYIKKKDIHIVKKSLLIKGAFVVLLLFFINLNNVINDIKQDKSLITDTRTFLIQEFFNPRTSTENQLIFGRGALGKYFSEYFYNLEYSGVHADSPYRTVIEMGYLQMVLKGGYILAFLWFFTLLPLSIIGMLGKNLLIRMCGYYIFGFLILWIVSYYPTFSAEFVLLWIAAGTIANKKIRNLTDNEIFDLKEYHG